MLYIKPLHCEKCVLTPEDTYINLKRVSVTWLTKKMGLACMQHSDSVSSGKPS